MASNRRTFCSQFATVALLPRLALSQSGSQAGSQSASPARPDIAAIDRVRILAAANDAITRAPKPLVAIAAPRTPGTPQDFYSEAEDYWPDPAKPAAPYVLRSSGPPNPTAFTAHRDALLNLCIDVPTLTAAFVLTGEQRYAGHAAAHLRSWFIDPATRMNASLLYARTIPPAREGRLEGVVDAVHIAEVVRCLPVLDGSTALNGDDAAALKRWFEEYFEWLTTSRLAGLARDNHSHHGTSWLLQAAAIARLGLATDDRPLTALRHQYQSSTIRAQMLADGTFPHELTTANPYRNSLFNLDMLAGICVLLSTRFEDAWSYELQDGPGMRSAIARHYPYILHRGEWPYRADAAHFNDLPLRQPSLLFAARAYDRPEYASLWKTLPADPVAIELQRAFPIRQPLLWATRSNL